MNEKDPSTHLIDLNTRLSPGKEKCELPQVKSVGEEKTKYIFDENRLDSELKRVFSQLREGQMIISLYFK